MANNEQDIISDAIIATNKEIFGDAFDLEDVTSEAGDRSQEAMGEGLEGQHEPDEGEGEEGEGEPETVEAKGEAKPEAVKPEATKLEPKGEDDDSIGRVPSRILRERTAKLTAAEAERDMLKSSLEAAQANSRKELDALRAEFDRRLAQLSQAKPADQPKPAEVKPEVPPDLFENPTAFAEYVQKGAAAQVQTLSKQMEDMRVNMSMENAHVRHKETFDAAFQTVQKLDPKNPDNQAIVRRIYASPNPGEALVNWHKRNETLREVGDDPAAYKARIAEDARKALREDPEFRKQLLADLRAEAETGDDGRARTTIKLPQSLNRAAGGNTRAPNDLEIYDSSPQAIFEAGFSN